MAKDIASSCGWEARKKARQGARGGEIGISGWADPGQELRLGRAKESQSKPRNISIKPNNFCLEKSI